ncbi:MAG TPA: CaiB/BaiF CoA-transferase family protein [Vicinamibacterales bacterium]|jgi:glutaryl-CoA transferase|nr:CaiB/BaiF CoA-transferase family protein [Vicinamibacterales bacterium]
MAGQGPLTGLTVLDLTRVLSGPYCTMFLGDMGARVIKIEQPGRGDDTRAWGPPFVKGESAYFLGTNRNKESVTLDFKHPGGRRLLDKLIERADVLIENFRPGALERAGLDYISLKQNHPRLIYTSISGFGHTGPRRHQPGYDAVIQAEGGLMSITGAPAGPPYRLGVAIADMVAGLLAAQGILLALYARERTGRGQHIDIGMLDGVVALLTYHSSMHLVANTSSPRVGNGHATIAPYDTFRASDGEFFLAVGNDEQFRRFCEAAGLQQLPTDSRFATNPARVEHRIELAAQLEPVLTQHSRKHWIAVLTEAGVPCGEVREVAEALADAQLLARQMIESVDHATIGPMKVLGLPIKLSDTPGSVRTAPPTLGQHTSAVLTELGLNASEIDALRQQKVI